MPSIPEELQSSKALQFVVSQGWDFKQVSPPRITIENCPYCGKGGHHLAMEVHASDDEERNRDGLHSCIRCGKSGNLNSLKVKVGVAIAGVEGRKDWGSAAREVEPLPDFEALHHALMSDEEALSYLTEGRGFSLTIIEKLKIGLKQDHFFRETGKVRALVYPYLVNGNAVWCHYRTLPTMPLSENKVVKAFSSPAGWDSTLYNRDVLQPGLADLIMVEGEANCIAAIDHGVKNIVGVPGANFKKAQWIDTIDQLGLEKVFVCYDSDKVGQRAAQVLASRIGIERCYKIQLPEFTVTTDQGVVRPGKDLNEWFSQGGGTAEAFEQLKQDATLFDVEGVTGSGDALQEFHDEILGKGITPKYTTAWAGVNKYIGFDDGDVIDILAPAKIGKTTFALNMVEHMVNQYGDDGIFICLEMTRAKMARKWLAHVAQIDDNNVGLDEEDAEALKQKFLHAIPEVQAMVANRPGELYFCSPTYRNMDDLYNLIRQVIRRYGVKWIVFDNIQRAADTTSQAKGANRSEHLSQISKVLSQIAKEFGVCMVRILQPKKIERGRIAGVGDTDGSGAIDKDCDCMFTLHRTAQGELSVDDFEQQSFVDEASSFGNEMFVGIPISRYSPGGRTTLYYEGARSTVKSFADEQIKTMADKKASKMINVGHEAQMKKLGIEPKVEPKPIDPKDGTVEL